MAAAIILPSLFRGNGRGVPKNDGNSRVVTIAMSTSDSCIFCKISRGDDEKTELLHSDDTMVVFRDLKPATPHHYLVTIKEHIPDAKHLNPGHLDLVERMVAVGKQVVQARGGDTNDIRMGFHWPPFHMITHLHLHVISSTNQMGWIAKGIFLPNSYWFVSADWVLERLRKQESKLVSSS